MTYPSRIPQFYAMDPVSRLQLLQSKTDVDLSNLSGAALSLEEADRMIENAVGVFCLPLGIAANFLVDGKSVLIPMAIEEPSVIAACSNMAAKIGLSGGFKTEVTDPIMTGQIWLTDVMDIDRVIAAIRDHRDELVDRANNLCPGMVKRGGGCKDISVGLAPSPRRDYIPSTLSLEGRGENFACINVHVDVRDAMGANIVNTLCEGLAPRIQELCGGEVLMGILTNYCNKRMSKASFFMPLRAMASHQSGDDGVEICRRIVLANAVAKVDPARACTHNKGIFNGVDAVAIATGNDWRGIEAAGHAHAARDGQYRALTDYWIDEENGLFCGSLSLPLSVGVVGGSTKSNPATKACLEVLGNFGSNAQKLSGLMASVGLAQNLGALRALVCEGIQAGHMRLHGRKVI